MSTLEQIKHGVARAIDAVAEGWRELTTRAGEALTRFSPVHRDDDHETRDAQRLAAAARWGVLAAEIAVDDEHVEVALEIPGMDASDFHIDLIEDLLVVRGEKRIERDSRRGQYYVMERAYGCFERAMRLPVAVEESGISARYQRGVLKVTLPRAAHSRARRIPVHAG